MGAPKSASVHGLWSSEIRPFFMYMHKKVPKALPTYTRIRRGLFQQQNRQNTLIVEARSISTTKLAEHTNRGSRATSPRPFLDPSVHRCGHQATAYHSASDTSEKALCSTAPNTPLSPADGPALAPRAPKCALVYVPECSRHRSLESKMGHALQGKNKACPEKSQDGLLPDKEHDRVTRSNSNTEASQKPYTQHEIAFIKLKIELNDTLLGIHVYVVNCMRKGGEEDGYQWGLW